MKNTHDKGAVETTSQPQELYQVKQCRQKQARTLLPVSSFQQKTVGRKGGKRIKKKEATKQDIARRKNEEL
jgi:hypothetical protein